MSAPTQRRAVVLALALASVLLAAALPAAAGASRVEDPSLRTATSNTYRVDGGRLMTRFFTHTVNFRDANGAWRRIDDDLVASERRGYALTTQATPY